MKQVPVKGTIVPSYSFGKQTQSEGPGWGPLGLRPSQYEILQGKEEASL